MPVQFDKSVIIYLKREDWLELRALLRHRRIPLARWTRQLMLKGKQEMQLEGSERQVQVS